MRWTGVSLSPQGGSRAPGKLRSPRRASASVCLCLSVPESVQVSLSPHVTVRVSPLPGRVRRVWSPPGRKEGAPVLSGFVSYRPGLSTPRPESGLRGQRCWVTPKSRNEEAGDVRAGSDSRGRATELCCLELWRWAVCVRTGGRDTGAVGSIDCSTEGIGHRG